MATRINADGTRTEIAPADGATFSLVELQTIVGGYIEAVRLRSGAWMFVNEDGKRLGLPTNVVATTIAHERGYLPADDWIVGDVIVTTPHEAGAGEP
jgi:hypothetical protein